MTGTEVLVVGGAIRTVVLEAAGAAGVEVLEAAVVGGGSAFRAPAPHAPPTRTAAAATATILTTMRCQ
jgi:hypothetical protein